MTPDENAFIAQVAGGAQQAQGETGIPASITIAQAILESGWGKTKLATEDFNYFGIKATEGEMYCEFATREYINGVAEVVNAKFAKYASAAQCFAAHTRLLATTSRYAPAMKMARGPLSFAIKLQECGYSTNPSYADQLMDLVDEFKLRQYDAEQQPAAVVTA